MKGGTAAPLVRRRGALAAAPLCGVLAAGGGRARAACPGGGALRQERGPGGGYTFVVPEAWERQRVRGVEQLWSPRGDVEQGSNLTVTTLVVPKGSEQAAAEAVVANVKATSGVRGEARRRTNGVEVLVLEVERKAAGEGAAGDGGGYSLAAGPGLRIKTDGAAAEEPSSFLLSLAAREGEGRVFLQTLQVFPSSLDADCARVVAERFMEGAPE